MRHLYKLSIIATEAKIILSCFFPSQLSIFRHLRELVQLWYYFLHEKALSDFCIVLAELPSYTMSDVLFEDSIQHYTERRLKPILETQIIDSDLLFYGINKSLSLKYNLYRISLNIYE